MPRPPGPPGHKGLRRLSHRKESALQTACLGVFGAYGIIAYPMNREKAGRRYAPHVGFAGLPDVGGTIQGTGQSFYAEIKLPGAKPSLAQVVAMQVLARAKAFVCLVHSVEEARDAARRATGR